MTTFGPAELLDCYARGVFPMADARDDDAVFLIDPEQRGVIPLADFYLPKRLARTVRRDPFEVRIDTAFSEVVLACAEARPGRTETWINGPIERLYADLFAIGHAHSVECWFEGEMVGGLYGVSLLRREHVLHPHGRLQGGPDTPGGEADRRPLRAAGRPVHD